LFWRRWESGGEGRASVAIPLQRLPKKPVDPRLTRTSSNFFGPHAANVSGLTDQTDLYYTMRDALGLK